MSIITHTSVDTENLYFLNFQFITKTFTRHEIASFHENSSDNTPYEKVGNNDPVSIADEVPFEIPENWEWIRLGSLLQIESGKGLTAKNMQPGDIPVYGGNGITGYHNTALVYEETVVIGRVGYYCGSVHVTESKAWITDNAFITTYPQKSVDRSYLVYCLTQMDLGRNNNATAQPVVSGKKIYPLLFPLPPLAEQKRIANRLKKIEPLVSSYAETENKLYILNNNFPDLLKKSILQMAAQGKLVPQDPNDEPASALLERIRTEKERLFKEGKIKRDKNESVIFRRDNSHYEKLGSTERCIDNEIPFDLPDSWIWCRMSSLFSINPRNQLSDDTVVGFMPMPLLENGFRNNHSFEERKWGDVKSGFTHFKNGDVVIAKITPCFQNRKSAVIVGLPNGYGAGTTELHVLRDDAQILFMPYFLLCCKTHDFIAGGVANFTGTAGQQRVGRDYISSYLIPLPPVQEQVRIVDAAKSILASLDELL